MKNDHRFWLWGYVLEKVPGKAFFVDGTTSCSLETAADYLNCDNLFWMNPLHSMDALNDFQCELLSRFGTVIGGLTHIEANGPGLGNWQMYYRESAIKLAKLSLRYPNIKGAIIDDFRSAVGPSKNMTDEELHAVYSSMKEINPALKLYLVQYHTTQDIRKLETCRNDFDGLTLWSWNSTDYFWDALYHESIRVVREHFPDKELNQGQFIHAYGEGNFAQPMDQLKKQCSKFAYSLDRKNIDGWCALQSGWFCREDHREQVEYLKNFWDWYRNTRTIR